MAKTQNVMGVKAWELRGASRSYVRQGLPPEREETAGMGALTAVLAIQATWERLPVPEVLVVHRVRANLEVARIPVILALVGTLGLPHPRRFLATST